MNRQPLSGFGLEKHIIFASEFLEEPLLGLSDFLFIFFKTLFDIGSAMDHQTPEQFGQLTRQGQIGHQTASPCLKSAVEAAQSFVHRPTDAACNHTEQSPSPITSTSLAASALATLMATGRQTQPGSEVFFVLPILTQIGPHFGHQLQQYIIGYSRQNGQILVPTQPPQQRVQSGNLRGVNSAAFECWRGRFSRILRTSYFLEHFLDSLVALANFLLVDLPQLIGLTQSKQVLLFPIAFQCRPQAADFVLLHLRITQGNQGYWIALTLEDSLHHLQTTHTGQIAEHVVNLEIHSVQRFLHVLLVTGRHRDVIGAHPQVVLQPANMLRRYETRLEQTVSVQRCLPLTVFHIGFAAGQVLNVLAVDDHHLEAALFQHLIRAEPVNAGGLHRDRTHALSLEPISQLMQLACGRAENFGRTTGYRNMELFTAHIYGGSCRVKHRQGGSRHIDLRIQPIASPRPARIEKNKSLQREAKAHQSIRMSLAGTNLSNEQTRNRALHILMRSRCAATRRGSSTRFMVPMRVKKEMAAFHEPQGITPINSKI